MAVSAAVVLTFAAGVLTDVPHLSDWPAQELGTLSAGDGFYQLDWDSDGHLQLAWIGAYGPSYALLYGEMIGTEWKITYLSRLLYEHHGTSMALDSQDNVYVCTSCREGAEFTTLGPSIIFAKNVGGSWDGEVINTTGLCNSSFVAVDGDDNVHLITCQESPYYEYDHNVTIIDSVRTDDGWEDSVLKRLDGTDTDIYLYDVDARPDGSIGMIYQTVNDTSHESEMNYSILSAGILVDSTIASPYGDGYAGLPALCHDRAGYAYVSTYGVGPDGYSIGYFTNSQGTWTRTDVGYGGTFMAGRSDVSVGDDESIYIGYFTSVVDGDVHNHSVRYSTNEDGTWKTHVIDDCDGWTGEESIAVLPDAEKNTHIVYFQRTNTDSGDKKATIYVTSDLPDDRYASMVIASATFATSVGFLIFVVLLLMWRRQITRKKKLEAMEEIGLYE